MLNLMYFLAAAAADPLDGPVLEGEASKLFGHNMRDMLLLGGMILALATALFLYAYITRKKHRATIALAGSRSTGPNRRRIRILGAIARNVGRATIRNFCRATRPFRRPADCLRCAQKNRPNRPNNCSDAARPRHHAEKRFQPCVGLRPIAARKARCNVRPLRLLPRDR